jgi:hypothetical protein
MTIQFTSLASVEAVTLPIQLSAIDGHAPCYLVKDLSGESDYENETWGTGLDEASSLIAECAGSPNARHPADWPKQNAGWHVYCFES